MAHITKVRRERTFSALQYTTQENWDRRGLSPLNTSEVNNKGWIRAKLNTSARARDWAQLRMNDYSLTLEFCSHPTHTVSFTCSHTLNDFHDNFQKLERNALALIYPADWNLKWPERDVSEKFWFEDFSQQNACHWLVLRLRRDYKTEAACVSVQLSALVELAGWEVQVFETLHEADSQSLLWGFALPLHVLCPIVKPTDSSLKCISTRKRGMLCRMSGWNNSSSEAICIWATSIATNRNQRLNNQRPEKNSSHQFISLTLNAWQNHYLYPCEFFVRRLLLNIK